MKIVFMGTPDFAVPSLKALVDNNFDVALVVTQPDKAVGRGKKIIPTPVKKYALECGLEVYQPTSVNDSESIEVINNIKPDVIVVAAYGQLLKRKLLDIPQKAIINVHSSLLPKYRGASPINHAIINGEEITGVTIMEVAEGLDSGDIIASKKIAISDMDAEELTTEMAKLGAELLVEVMKDFDNFYKNRKPQNHEESTHIGKFSKDMGLIDWGKSAKEIHNLVRGLKPWPIAFSHYKDDVMKIYKTRVNSEEFSGNPGEIVKADNTGIYVMTGNGALVIENLQMPNKRAMKVSEFLAGNKIEIGEVLKGR